MQRSNRNVESGAIDPYNKSFITVYHRVIPIVYIDVAVYLKPQPYHRQKGSQNHSVLCCCSLCLVTVIDHKPPFCKSRGKYIDNTITTDLTTAKTRLVPIMLA